MSNRMEQAAECVHRAIKTDALIRMLAESPEVWTEEDIDRAVQETGSYRFSLADVSYMHLILNDDKMQAAQKLLTHRYQEMAKCNTVERVELWKTQVKSEQDAAHIYRTEMKRQFPGLMFYA